MSFYSQRIFPWLLKRIMDHKILARYRQDLLAEAQGEVLEIGFGTAANLKFYPSSRVQKLTAIEPNPGMEKFWSEVVKGAAIPARVELAAAEALPFASESFDSVVSTFTVCSVDAPEKVFSELYRVLKKGGRLLLLEHGRSPDLSVYHWQCRLNRINRRLADGCNLDRDMSALVRQAGFEWQKLDNFYLKKAPRTHGYLFQGIAIKPL